LNPSGQILCKTLVAVGTLADGDMFGLFAFDVLAVIHFDARSAGITAAAFERVGHFFVNLHLRAVLQQQSHVAKYSTTP
jgi:uncharacterized membrane protein YuzA (DUF378 family)